MSISLRYFLTRLPGQIACFSRMKFLSIQFISEWYLTPLELHKGNYLYN